MNMGQVRNSIRMHHLPRKGPRVNSYLPTRCFSRKKKKKRVQKEHMMTNNLTPHELGEEPDSCVVFCRYQNMKRRQTANIAVL